ncbi:hypothetical protein A9G34_05035 [Gilliamella sp. Choc4-2]|nr:N-acetylmuramoyl-L-alanine amidase [Gilliamella apicola]OCG46508.1 hypothetical protein A9G34_05035 [Gilliamella apicola]
MRELQQILTGTLIYSTQRKKDLPPPTFTDRDLKEGLRRSWTAEQIGHLLVKYESEWYADEGLSKWNEVDELFEEEKQQQKALIEAGLDKLGITEPYQRDFAMKKVDEAHEHVKSNWQLEKEERIKPSLWWKKVAQAQSSQKSNDNTLALSNLSMDGKAWFMNPVGVINIFNKKSNINNEGFICNDSIIQYQVKKLERGNIIGPNAIVLHRTYSKGSAINVIENTWKSPWNKDNIGAHFVIDKDGTIYQVVSLKKYANHVGVIRPRCELTRTCDTNYRSKTYREKYLSELKKDYPERYPYNQDSIGIEVVAWWDDKTKLWDDATPQQLESIRNLVIFLQKEFNLNDKDLYQHQCIAYKTSGEGKNLYPPADNWNIDPRHY